MSAPYWEPLAAIPGGALPPPTTPGDDGKWLRAQGGAAVWTAQPNRVTRVRRGSVQSIAPGSVSIIWTTADRDFDGMWSAGAPDRLTVKTAGVYLLVGVGGFDSGGTGYRQISLMAAGIAVALDSKQPSVSPASTWGCVSAIVPLSVNDLIQINAEHNNGSAVNISAYAAMPNLAAYYLGS